MHVVMYSKQNCSLCEMAMDILKQLQTDFLFTIEEVDIYQDEALLEKYQIMIPVVMMDGEEVDSGIIEMAKVEKFLVSYEKN